MTIQQVALSDKEKELVQEVQTKLGFKSIEETLEYLAKQRIQELLAKLAGQELKSHRHHF
ncbi:MULTISPECIES: hypothetical protein [Acinetobacter]|uniref:hypothetical protein n=1 Tax=Acinetobacter TaxID=469 RepID=UPI0002D08861|nr:MULTISPECIES: hypothetical protein [Acinetobacter]ENU88509.1 hypothetical protein F972_02073 [Acinetobacter sp. CIP 102529]MCU4392820.1 hypothetical protein [Acinetobacter parvus]MDC5039418.1 hypothetical protein [Acinetobacter baumannii]MDG9947722.1 hypothetical protein [Acinetobacter ursingii]MDR0079189.1 hypothetical protein [Acinetobacter baumannii]